MNLVINLTDKCNLRCDYCYFGDNDRKDDMTPATLDKTFDFFIDFAGKMKDDALVMTFFGGEPLVRYEEMKRAVKYCEDSGAKLKFKYAINTNGTLITGEILDYFAEKQFTIFLSIDGRAPLHNKHRGAGAFEKFEPYLKRLAEMNAVAEKVITADGAGEVYDSVAYFRDLGFKGVMMQPDFAPNWTRKEFDVLISEYERVADLYKKAKLAKENFTVNVIEERIKTAIAGGSIKKTSCNAGERIYAVSPRGELFPCTHFVSKTDKRYVLGNIFDGFDTKAVLKFRLFHEKDKPECEDCTIKDQCIGNSCACTSYTTMGDIYKISPMVCEHERAIVRIADRVAQSLADKQLAKKGKKKK